MGLVTFTSQALACGSGRKERKREEKFILPTFLTPPQTPSLTSPITQFSSPQSVILCSEGQ